jgi:hypothetical protein
MLLLVKAPGFLQYLNAKNVNDNINPTTNWTAYSKQIAFCPTAPAATSIAIVYLFMLISEKWVSNQANLTCNYKHDDN